MPSKQPTNTPVAKVVTLPDGIEIFRAGRHIDDGGVTHEFSEAGGVHQAQPCAG